LIGLGVAGVVLRRLVPHHVPASDKRRGYDDAGDSKQLCVAMHDDPFL
jgi:hypothetical protein